MFVGTKGNVERRKQILEAYQKGEKTEWISHVFGVSRGLPSYIARQYGTVRKPWLAPNKRKYINAYCTFCGIGIDRKPSELTDRVFCCREHSDAWRARNRQKFSCEICGVEIVRKPFHAKRHRKNDKAFCCRQHWHQWRIKNLKKNLTKENNFNINNSVIVEASKDGGAVPPISTNGDDLGSILG